MTAAPGRAIAISRPAWRKSAFWPNLLARLAVGAAAAVLAGNVAGLFAYGEISADSLGEAGYAKLRLAALVLGTVMVVGLAGSLFVARLAHRRANAAVNALVASGGDLPADEVVCLYLRSFDASKAFAWRRTWLSLGANVTLHDPETDIDTAVGERCTLIAIGDRFDSRGALKISTIDERWFDIFEALADRAVLIVCFLGATPSSRREITHIQSSPRLFKKTVFVVPPETDKGHFETVRVAAADVGITLPHHDARGFAFRPSRGRSYMQIVPYARMMSVLGRAALESPDIGTEIWRESPYFGLDQGDGQ